MVGRFTLTACSALLENQDVTKTATFFLKEMLDCVAFVNLYTFLLENSFVPFILRHWGSRYVHIHAKIAASLWAHI